MVASVAAGLHESIYAAQDAMGQGWRTTYAPDAERAGALDRRYADYRALGAFEQARAAS